MPSSLLNNLPTALTAANNAATDLFYVAIDPFTVADDRKQTRTDLFAQVPVPVGLGKPGTVQGSLLFYNSNNSNSITFRAETPAASLIYEWPNASPTVGQVLSASAPAAGVVTLTWATVSASPGGSTTQVQFNNAGAFGGSANLTWVSPVLTVTGQLAMGNIVGAPSPVADQAIFYAKDVIATRSNGFVIAESGNIARLTDTIVYLTSNASSTSSTVASTNLVLNVEATTRYRFVARLHYNSQGVGGVRFSLGGTATITSVIANYQIANDGSGTAFIRQQTTAFATQVALAGAGDVGYAEINFEVVINAGGTVLVNFGQQATNGTASLLLAGSSLELAQS